MIICVDAETMKVALESTLLNGVVIISYDPRMVKMLKIRSEYSMG